MLVAEFDESRVVSLSKLLQNRGGPKDPCVMHVFRLHCSLNISWERVSMSCIAVNCRGRIRSWQDLSLEWPLIIYKKYIWYAWHSTTRWWLPSMGFWEAVHVCSWVALDLYRISVRTHGTQSRCIYYWVAHITLYSLYKAHATRIHH